MGHNTLGVLPKTTHWKSVAHLLTDGAGTEEVISASALAAERDLINASRDPVFVEAVRLMLAIPAVARSDDFGSALRQLELRVGQAPELLDVALAVTERLDSVARRGGAVSDLGQLAARALVATLTTSIGDQLPGLFTSTPADVQAAARKLSWNRAFAEYARTFFSRLLADSLSYWLDRKLDDHIGAGQRFQAVSDRSAFDLELDRFAFESSRIIREFSGGWYGKTLHRDGGFTAATAATFGHVALKKIVDDLRTRFDRDD